MVLFSELISIVVTGLAATLVGLFIVGNFSYLIRNSFTWRDPGLGWDPGAGLDDRAFSSDRRVPDLSPNIAASLWDD